jgi:hypothetical protein
MNYINRWRCGECGKAYTVGQLLCAKSPFSDDEIYGCPNCKAVECFAEICDEPMCLEVAGCGWPTEDGGYRRTCYAHSQFAKESK